MKQNILAFKGVKIVLAGLACTTFIQGLAIIFQAKYLSELINALYKGTTIREQYDVIILFLLAFIVRHWIHLIQQKLASSYAEKTSKNLRVQLLNVLFQLGPRFVKKEGSGNVTTLILEGISQFKTYLQLFLPRMTATAILPAMILLYVYTLDWVSGLILTITLPILIIFLILVGLAARSQTDKQWASYRILSNHFLDSLRGLETLKYIGKSKKHGKSIENVSTQYRKATMKTLRLAFLSSFALDFFTMLSVASVAVSLGVRLVDSHLSLLTGLTILILAPEYFLPVRMVGSDYHATLNGKEAGERINKIISETDGQAEITTSKIENTSIEDITFQSVDFTYKEGENAVLNNLSFTINGKKKVGIVGKSGSGKSTFIDVLSGFLPISQGSTFVNNEPTSLQSSNWTDRITYIPQHPYLYSATVRDNIAFYTPEATKEEINKALEATELFDFVKTLPNGLDETIGGAGRILSGGQTQRIALARALLGKKDILILDEPTSHLDIETEFELKQTMLPLFEHKLVFLATHRLHWMKHMDIIFVLDEGAIVEIGSHEELLEKKGTYYQLMKDEGGYTL